jgi:hypothetical protein
MRHDGRDVAAAQIENLFLDPAFQRRGIFLANLLGLTDRLAAEVEYVITLSPKLSPRSCSIAWPYGRCRTTPCAICCSTSASPRKPRHARPLQGVFGTMLAALRPTRGLLPRHERIPMSTRCSGLCVIAHADDLELMAGGTVAKRDRRGSRGARPDDLERSVHRSVWRRHARRAGGVGRGATRAACLGYTVENPGLSAMDLKFEDRLVVEVVRRIEARRADTLLCPWERDVHHDHEVVSRIAVSATRRVSRALMGQINYYLRDFFRPNEPLSELS